MKHFLLSAILLLSLNAFAQKPPVKYGDFSEEEINMKYYPKDSSAAAVVLVDYGHAYISLAVGRLIFERHKRIKILKKEGLDLANFSIPLYHSSGSKESVANLKVTTYNFENGKAVATKMSKSSIYEEKFNKEVDLYKFALENVKVGSILEVSYKVYSEFFFNFPSWEFQSSIPVVWSEYRADIPDFFVYEKYMQGYLPLIINEANKKNQRNYTTTANRWVVQDAPAFEEEPYMTCEDDYISKINFALSHYKLNGVYHDYMGSWEKIRENLLEADYFGDIVKGSGFLNKTTKELTSGISDPKEKVKVIYDYIKQTLLWNGVADYGTYSLKDAFKEGKGSSADINLALASMLREAGLDVDLVVLSTRDHGFVRPIYSMLRQFNYVICAVNLGDKRLLIDATDRTLPMKILPERCLNGQGLLISENKGIEWVKLEAENKSKTLITSKVQMDETGKITGEINLARSRYDAYRMRKQYQANGEEEYLKHFVSGKSWNITHSEFNGLEEIANQVKEKHEIEINDHAMVAGNMIYVNPFLLSRVEENPFKSLTREYPVDFGSPFEKIYIGQITIPEGFAVEALPERKIIALPGNAGKFSLNVVNNGNSIFVSSNFSINKSMFVQTEYPNLREFYNQMVAMQAQQIVLKKIN